MAGDENDLNAGDETLDEAFIDDAVADDAVAEDVVVEEEAILDEMDQVRGKLGSGIDRLGEEMKNVFDWQAYVRSAPLTSVGIAAAVGYLLAPSLRSRPVVQVVSVPAGESLTASQVTPPPSGGIFSYLTSTAFAAATRFATAYVTDMLFNPTSEPTANGERPRSARSSYGQPNQGSDLGL